MKKLVLVPLVIVLAVGLIFGSCAEPAPAPAPSPAPAPAPAPSPPAKEIPKEIRIGTVSSLTGMFAGFGTGGSWGLAAACDDINNSGGIYVKEYDAQIPVRHILLNCESDPIKAGTLAENLILGEKVHFLANNPEPITVQIEKNNLADRYKIPNCAGTGPYEPYLEVREHVESKWEYTWDWSFGIVTPPPEGDYRYGKPGWTILDTWKTWLDMFGDQTNKSVGVYASDDPDGIGWYGLFSGALEEWGYNVVGENQFGLFPMGTTDFRPLIQEWKDNEVEILWGNCPAPDFGTMWRQAQAMDFKPKMVGAARAALFYEEVTAWGGDLPLGVFIEMWWHPSMDPETCPGIGGTTPQSLAERWTQETGLPINIATGWAYCNVQVLKDAIERAGTLDGEAVNAAIAETNMLPTIDGPGLYYLPTHHNWSPLFIGQWNKTDKPQGWELPIVFSTHDFIPATVEPIFPIPYD